MKKTVSIQNMVITAMLAALVIILQFLSMNLRFSMFSITLTLVPIVIGASLCGPVSGAILGLVFGLAVLLTGDATAFWVINIPGTLITVLLKGMVSGLSASFTYKLMSKINTYIGALSAAIISPVANTGVFLLSCLVFFMPAISSWAFELGYGENVAKYMFLGLAGTNFLIELLVNVVLVPVIVYIIKIKNKKLY